MSRKLSSRRPQRTLGRRSHHLHLVHRHTIMLNSAAELRKVFGWQAPIALPEEDLLAYVNPEDVNDRKLRDAESIAIAAANCAVGDVLEIGTGRGYSTALIAKNAPRARIHTLNIPPDEYEQSGDLSTMKLSKEEIGSYYRSQGHRNVRQIYANSLRWIADVDSADLAFIDGAHDTEIVISDTMKALGCLKAGGFILWHDFNPTLANNYHWIESVCEAVGNLYATKTLRGRTYVVRDSWVGVHQIIAR